MAVRTTATAMDRATSSATLGYVDARTAGRATTATLPWRQSAKAGVMKTAVCITFSVCKILMDAKFRRGAGMTILRISFFVADSRGTAVGAPLPLWTVATFSESRLLPCKETLIKKITLLSHAQCLERAQLRTMANSKTPRE